MTRLVYRPRAVADLDVIFDYIAVDSSKNAAAFVGDIRDHCRRLKEFPELGPARADLGKGSASFQSSDASSWPTGSPRPRS